MIQLINAWFEGYSPKFSSPIWYFADSPKFYAANISRYTVNWNYYLFDTTELLFIGHLVEVSCFQQTPMQIEQVTPAASHCY